MIGANGIGNGNREVFLALNIKISERSRIMDLRNLVLYNTMRISERSGPQSPESPSKKKGLQLQLCLAS